VLDLGAGDGQFVLATAAAQPGTLVIGIDATASAMVEASRRALRPARRGGLANALFVVAAAESLPAELDGRADAITIQFPWGSLLRGVLCADPVLVEGLLRVTRPDALVSMLVSVTERDRAVETGPLDERAMAALAGRYAALGLAPIERRRAGPDDLARAHSSWAKRLGAGREVWYLRLQRRDGPDRLSAPNRRIEQRGNRPPGHGQPPTRRSTV
jgi:16S rRNA (adenine(1408)-N(1))-methyltransferase